jgi:hypothetical protein
MGLCLLWPTFYQSFARGPLLQQLPSKAGMPGTQEQVTVRVLPEAAHRSVSQANDDRKAVIRLDGIIEIYINLHRSTLDARAVYSILIKSSPVPDVSGLVGSLVIGLTLSGDITTENRTENGDHTNPKRKAPCADFLLFVWSPFFRVLPT